jgi:hypothetical protein
MLICLNTRYQRKTWTRTPRHTLRLRLAGSQAAAACHEQIIIGALLKTSATKNLHLVPHMHPMNEASLHGAAHEAGRIF